MRYADALINAKEIHVIDSSFLHLAESLPVKGKVFLHSGCPGGCSGTRPTDILFKLYNRVTYV